MYRSSSIESYRIQATGATPPDVLALRSFSETMTSLQRPLNANRWIIPADTRFCFAVVDSRALVLNFGAISERAESAREASGRPHLLGGSRALLLPRPISQLSANLCEYPPPPERPPARSRA